MIAANDPTPHDGARVLTEGERRRALGEAYAYLLSLAAKHRAGQVTIEPTTTEKSDHDDRKIPES